MLKTPRKVIQKQVLFSKNDRLLVGVSGGLDSMVLVDVLFEEGFQFSIAHCNYGLRGKDSDLDEKLIYNWASERKIPCFIKHCPIQNASNLQESARNVRYQYFQEIKIQEKINFILTAHHADDQIETFLINLSRGAGLKGLKAMPFQNNDLKRPFLEIRKSALYDYAIENDVPYRDDFTNQASHYLRNFFRNEVLTLLNKRIPSFDELALRSIHHLSELQLLLDVLFQEWKMENVNLSFENIQIKKPSLDKYYFVSLLLVEYGFHPETIENIKANYLNSGTLFTDKNQHELLIDRDFLFLRKKITVNHANETFSIELPSGSFATKFGQLSWSVETNINEIPQLIISHSNCQLDLDRIQFPLIFRKWLPGDIIQPFGMEGKHKKVQDVLSNLKMSLFEKEKLYLLTSGDDILWIPDVIRSEIAKISLNTKNIINFKYIQSVFN